MKSKLESLFVIIIMVLSIANIKFCADAIASLSDNTEKIYITQGEIKSKQYLVTDEYISRISPKTTVESFVMQLGIEDKEIAIYENHDKQEEVTEGLISTGMVMTVRNPETEEVETEKVEENTSDVEQEENINEATQEEKEETVEKEEETLGEGQEEVVETEEENLGEEKTAKEKEYELSVVGDTNKDGNANIVEVVQIINHLAGFEGKELSGIELVSSDINGDTEVNLIDIDKLIRYIVFEELEIGEVGAPQAPTIEAEGNERNDWYKEDTKVRIESKEEGFIKTVYTIDGETFETTNKEEEKTIKQEGTHKIEAYTYGANGSKSSVTEKEIKIDKEAPEIESITKTPEEETNETVVIEITAKDNLSGLDEEAYSFDGGLTWQKEGSKEYTENQEEIEICVRDKAGNIKEETTSIENIKLEKEKYEIVFKNYDGTTLQSEELEYGSMPEYKGEVPTKAEDETYTYEFAGWDKEVIEVTGNAEYIATYTETYKNYTIIFKNEDGSVITEKTDYHYGDTVEVPEVPTKAEDETYTYEFAGWKTNESEEIIEVEVEVIGNAEYIATYKETYKNYTVVFKNEDGSVITEKTGYHYGDTVEVPENPSKEKTGYVVTFAGWKTNESEEIVEVEAEVKENKEYIAKYNEEIIEYTIEYELNGGSVSGENPTRYNVETETFTLNNPTKNLYKFIGWTLNEETEAIENVSIEKGSIGNRKYTANWELSTHAVKIQETDKIYGSIEMALEEIENGQTMIILDNLTEGVVIEENRNITIDLNGKTITNPNEAESTIVNKGTLTIIDSSENQEGKIINTTNNVIKNEASGEITIGNKENSVTESPYIKGNEIGIKNEGILKFYDGKIEANKAIEGTINETPENYNTVMKKTETEEGETKQVAQLGIMADSVARIGSMYYTSLQEAIDTLKTTEITEEPEEAYEKYNKEGLVLQLDGEQNTKDLGHVGDATIWEDISGISNTTATTKAGTIKWQEKALVLDGNTYLNVPSPLTDSFGTIEVAVQIPEDFAPVNTDEWAKASCIIGCELSWWHKDCAIIISKDGYFAVGYYNTTTKKDTITSSTIKANDGNIHTVTYAYMEDHISFYVDGQLIETIEYIPAGNSIETYGIGWNVAGSGTKIKGNIYSIRFYNDELTGEEISSNYLVDKARFIDNIPKEEIPVQEQTTIILVKDITLTDAIDIEKYMNVELDLNGKTFTTTNANFALKNTGRLEISDSSEEQTGKITTSSSSNTIFNVSGALLTISGGTISNEKQGVSNVNQFTRVINNNGILNVIGGNLYTKARYVTIIDNSKEVNISGGNIRNDNSSNGRCIYNRLKLTINNSDIYGAGDYSIESVWNSNTEINGGTIYNNSYGIVVRDNATMLIDNVDLISTNNGAAVYSSSLGEITINNGYFKSISRFAVENESIKGIININGGVFESNTGSAVHNTKTGTVNINGGTYTCNNETIYNKSTGTINIEDGNITSNNGNAIRNQDAGIINIFGGVFTAEKGNTVQNQSSGNIYINSGEIIAKSASGVNNIGTGKIIIGNKDQELSVESPKIQAKTYGANGNATYYNGKIMGQEDIISGSFDETRENYKINLGEEILTEGVYKVATLTEEAKEENVEYNGNMYSSIQEAVNEIVKSETKSESTINLLKDNYIISESEKVVIPEEYNIIIDLKGNKIRQYINESVIDNNGTLKISDSSEEKTGKIETKGIERTIYNKGLLNINNILIQYESKIPNKTISAIYNDGEANIVNTNITLNSTATGNTGAAIYNTGILNLDNSEGKIEVVNSGSNNSLSGILNKGTEDKEAVATITDATITVNTAKGIKNYGKLVIENINLSATKDNGIVNYNGGIIEKIETGRIFATGTSVYDSPLPTIYNENGGIIKGLGKEESEKKLVIYGTNKAIDGQKCIHNAGTIGNLLDASINKFEGTAIKNNVLIEGETTAGWSFGHIIAIYNEKTGKIGKIDAEIGEFGNNSNKIGIENYGYIEEFSGKVGATYDDGNQSDKANQVNETIKNKGTIGKITGSINQPVGAIAINNSGTIEEINSSMIYAVKYAIQNTGEIGTLVGNIGNGGSEVSEYGVFNTGTIAYNGGELYGTTNPVLGTITTIPKEKEIQREVFEDNSYSKFYLQDKTGTFKIGETTYDALKEAIEAAGNNKTEILILKDYITNENLTVGEGQDITIDLNGHSIDAYVDGYLFTNNGKLSIENSKEDKSTIKSVYGIIDNTGEVNINNISMNTYLGGTTSAFKNMINNNGENAVVNISNTDVDTTIGCINIVNNIKGTVNYNSGTIIGRGTYTRIFNNTDKLNINGVALSTKATDQTFIIFNNSNAETSGQVIINDVSDFSSAYCGIQNDKTGNITIKKGTFTTTNGEIVYHNSTGELIIEGGTFTGLGTRTHMIRNGNKGIVTIKGGNFTTEKNVYILSNESTGTINVEGGTYLNTVTSAIYNGSTGNIIVGKKDNDVSVETPVIRSNTQYGIYNNSTGKINFYDGAILGKEGTVYGTITEIPEGYSINNETVTVDLEYNLQRYTLIANGTNTSEAELNGIYYDTLKEAIESCGNTESTITLQRNVNTEEIINIGEGQVITIDLNGYTITGTIQNDGTLSITNSKGNIVEGSYGTITGNTPSIY